MFTGIIEEMGVVQTLVKGLQGTGLTIFAKNVMEGLAIGESIALSGACMTVVGCETDRFRVDLSPETLKVTTLGVLKAGDPVNLERAMRLTSRLSGHVVTGHVDAVGTIRERTQDANAIQLTIEAPGEVLRLCVPKGAITVDGVSLTINEVMPQGCRVAIIPHTAKLTTLGIKRAGDPVNLESDLIGKYIDRLLQERVHGIRVLLELFGELLQDGDHRVQVFAGVVGSQIGAGEGLNALELRALFGACLGGDLREVHLEELSELLDFVVREPQRAAGTWRLSRRAGRG